MSISVVIEKVFDKIQYLFMIKRPEEIRDTKDISLHDKGR